MTDAIQEPKKHDPVLEKAREVILKCCDTWGGLHVTTMEVFDTTGGNNDKFIFIIRDDCDAPLRPLLLTLIEDDLLSALDPEAATSEPAWFRINEQRRTDVAQVFSVWCGKTFFIDVNITYAKAFLIGVRNTPATAHERMLTLSMEVLQDSLDEDDIYVDPDTNRHAFKLPERIGYAEVCSRLFCIYGKPDTEKMKKGGTVLNWQVEVPDLFGDSEVLISLQWHSNGDRALLLSTDWTGK